MKRLLLLSSVFLFASTSTVRGADTADLLKCIEPIKSACAGLEDDLETCLAERAALLPTDCQHVLQSAIEMSQSSDGSRVCLADVKKFCADLDVNALTQCIVTNKAHFSKACLDYLQSTPSPAASAATP